MNKLLHEPTVRLKAAAGTDLGSAYAETLAALFDLPDLTVDRRSGERSERATVSPIPRHGAASAASATDATVATRGSALARWQAERVIALLGRPAELVIVSTRGDERRDVEIHQLGGTGVFVKEVEQAVLDGRADLAVHSAKDLPSTTDAGLVLAAVPERADPRDALVGSTLDGLATGALRRDRIGAPARAARRRCAPICSSRACAATSTRASRVRARRGAIRSTRSSSPSAALDRLGRAAKPPRCSILR